MRPFAVLGVATVLALVLAGCSSTPPAATSSSTAAQKSAPSSQATTTAQPTSTTATSTASATSTSAPTTTPTATATPTPAPEPEVLVTKVDEAGFLGPAGIWVPTIGTGGFGASVYGQDRWFHYDIDGTVTGANLTMTWSAGPTSTKLQLTLSPTETTSDGGESYTEGTKSITGTSPLVLQLSDLDWSTGTYAVTAWYPESAGTAVVEPVDFTITGEIYSN